MKMNSMKDFKPYEFVIKYGDRILFVLFAIALVFCVFGCRSVSKSQKSTTAEDVQVSVKDSAVEKHSTSKSEATAKLFKSLTSDSSKVKTTSKTTIIEKPVFDSAGRIRSADKITYVGVIEERQNQVSDQKTDSSAHKINDSMDRFRAFVHGRDSSVSKMEIVESKKRVVDNRWMWALLIAALAALCWWKRGWIIERVVYFFT
jgi:hypothetical protein